MAKKKINRTLPMKRKMIIEKIKAHQNFFRVNAQKLDIFEGNLLPYIDAIMKLSLSPQYYNAIKERILPINILQRYIEKVSVAYSKEPTRTIEDGKEKPDPLAQQFLDFYKKQLDINTSGGVADTYASMFKGYAWEPYLDDNNKPKLRELPFDRFLVISDSVVNPEDGNIFAKILGNPNDEKGDCIIFAYTDTEFDAFKMDGSDCNEFLRDNDGVNLIGTIPFVYGKRQKNKLIPTQDSDILAFTKAIPVMLSDAAGAQMFQCFTILYGIDINFDNLKMAPNAIWNLKSDGTNEKQPVVGTLNPSADTEKVVKFIMTAFVLWLETKGIRVGSVGSVDAGSLASGISKIVDEMDVNKLVNKSMDWFEKDESELFNDKLPKIHEYWIRSGQLTVADSCPIVLNPNIVTKFERPEPMVTRSEEVNAIKTEIDMGTMLFEDAVRSLHPDYDDDKIALIVAQKFPAKENEDETKSEVENAVDKNDNRNPEGNKADGSGADS